MMIAMFFVGAFIGFGVSDGIYRQEVYGSSYFFVLYRNTTLVEFIPKDSTNVTVLWKEGERKLSTDKRFLIGSSYFSLSKITQQNSGRYVMRNKDGKELYSNTLKVIANTNSYTRKLGDSLGLSYRLEPNSCNIYFFPESGHQPGVMHKIVHQGKLQEGLDKLDCVGFGQTRTCGITNKFLHMSCKGRYEIRDENDNAALVVSLEMERITETLDRKPGESFDFSSEHMGTKSCNIRFFPEREHQTGDTSIDIVHQGRLQSNSDEPCTGFTLLYPCGISNDALQMECNGRYEIQDQNGDTAIEMLLEMEPLPYEPSHVGIGAGIFLSSLFCYCVRCCCRRKSSSKQSTTETVAVEPDAQYQEYDHEPVGPRRDQLTQPSEMHYSPPPPYTPMIHDYPTVNVPPPYSEVAAPAEPADDPAVPVHSDPGPHFELTGVTFPSAPPLNSDSTYCAVYTSDKLDFK